MNNDRRKLNDLLDARAQHLQAAQAAYDAEKPSDFDSEMEKVTNLTTEIEQLQALIREKDRKPAPAPSMAEANEALMARVEALRKGEEVTYDVGMVRAAMRGTPYDAVTLATGTLVEPEGGGTNIRGGDSAMSSILDQVSVIDATGLGAFYEPYVMTELTANGQKVTTAAGTARQAATDPTFGLAKLSPYEINVTAYVDRNLSRLSPAAYDAKIFNMAMRAMRRKAIELIYNGDGQGTPDFYGIKTAKNKDGDAIYQSVDVAAIDENTLDTLVFAYGGEEELGANAGLYLNKADLQAIGKLRGTNEKQRLFKIQNTPGNANTGTITDGGLFVPYTLASALTALSGSKAGSAAIQTMLYGDPKNFELALFGGFTVRLDESYKAGERLNTILGDAMVGGNLVADKGFVVATLPKSGS